MTPKERLKQIQETYCPTCRKYKRCRPFMLITMDEWVCLFHNELNLSDDDLLEKARQNACRQADQLNNQSSIPNRH